MSNATTASAENDYPGSELELFAHAVNWKRYFARRLKPYIGERVLEVGSGLGATMEVLMRPDIQHWTCLEPDDSMAAALLQRHERGALPEVCEVRHGTTASLLDHSAAFDFDSVLYIDVLEHIDDDQQELQRAASLLREGGRIIVLSPAHNWLYTPFDKAIGHFRRYNKARMRKISPRDAKLKRLMYLDSVGLCASMGNRFLLRKSMPSLQQIQLWDRFMVTNSRWMDPVTGYLIGKSIVGIWEKRAESIPEPAGSSE